MEYSCSGVAQIKRQYLKVLRSYWQIEASGSTVKTLCLLRLTLLTVQIARWSYGHEGCGKPAHP
jgi:hypothetical protein